MDSIKTNFMSTIMFTTIGSRVAHCGSNVCLMTSFIGVGARRTLFGRPPPLVMWRRAYANTATKGVKKRKDASDGDDMTVVIKARSLVESRKSGTLTTVQLFGSPFLPFPHSRHLSAVWSNSFMASPSLRVVWFEFWWAQLRKTADHLI